MAGRRAALADQGDDASTAPDRRPRRDRANTTWPTADHLAYATSGDISSFVRHPHDDGVWLGAVGILDALPAEIDAVVSLCRVGRSQVPGRIRPENRVAVWLIDEVDPRANPNLTFVLEDTVDAIAALRAEGRTVFVHCVQAISRTPTVGALYAARHRGIPIEQALREVTDALPHAHPNAAFVEALTPRTMGGF
ncbi:MAG: dual specificity protein phosphatase family protein [Ramlibacter sp.]|nr:dual specificity protein phosphatase family protein [Cryobacterium sp.]